MADELTEARREVEQEFEQVRKALEKVRESLAKVDAAGPEDDVYELLKDLEDTVEKVRTGGIIGSGAKGHREAQDKLKKLQGK